MRTRRASVRLAGFARGIRSASTSIVSTVFTYRDLEVWQLGMRLAQACYAATSALPKTEMYGLPSQLRRAAVSIPSNVAEGHARRSTRSYLHHVSIALGSQAELATCIDLSARLGFLAAPELERITALSDSVGRLLYRLHRSLAQKLQTPGNTQRGSR